MMAFAIHLLRTVPGLKEVVVHPDGEHGKRFDFRRWLEKHDFSMTKPLGQTSYGGVYSSGAGETVKIDPRSGHGDVVAEIGGHSVVAECKGGVINTKHPGQQSRLRQGLCETIGLSLASPIKQGGKQIVVVPRTQGTENLARKLATRAHVAGIDIALVDGRGNVFEVRPESS